MGPNLQHLLRAPTERELAHVAKVRARWHAGHGAGSPHEMLIAVAVAVAAVVVGVVNERASVIAIGSVMGLAMAAIYGLALRRARRERATRRGPWDLADGWRVCETTMFARAVIAAGSDNEDYATWLVFELDGAEWYALEASVVSDDPTGASLARERLVIASIEPDGPVLSATASGAPLPRRGGTIDSDSADRISASGDAYAKMIEAGFVWCPDRALPPAGGLVAAQELPPWMRQ